MNYYQHHIGDYRSDTGHLTPTEHGIYRQLLDWYYHDERPIPSETDFVMRRLSATTQKDKTAVKTVLKEFFFVTEEGYNHKRCEQELEKYRSRVGNAKANGIKGGRPKGSKDLKPRKPRITESVNFNNPEEPSGKLTTNHYPLTTNQEEEEEEEEEKENPPTPLKGGDRLSRKLERPDSTEGGKPPARSPKGRSRSTAAKFDPTAVDLPAGIDADLWRRWCTERTAQRKPLTPGAVRQQLENLQGWLARGLDANQSIRDSINSGWQGLFEPRPRNGGRRPAPVSDGIRTAYARDVVPNMDDLH